MKTIQVKDFREIPPGFTGIAKPANGSRVWYKDGELHREDGPAVEYASGSKEWRINGVLHREDGPAIENPDGTKFWWRNGKLHREDGPAVEHSDGSKSWYLNGIEFSSEGEWKAELEKRNMKTIQVKDYNEIPSGFTGIAEYSNGVKVWYKDGNYHREDGSAVEYPDGTKFWYLDGIEFSSEEKWKAELEKRNMKTIQIKDFRDIPSGFTGIVGYASGTKAWYKEGLLHREDGPAIEWSDGTKSWFKDGKYHREDGPAVEWEDGSKEWWRKGKLHREDGPAIERSDGTKKWFKEGLCHREDGPAVEEPDQSKFWYLDGTGFSSEGEWKAKLEKRNLKTIQVKDSCDIPLGFTGIVEYSNGSKVWYKEGKRHREDGPACEWSDGTKQWYLDGAIFSPKVVQKEEQKNLSEVSILVLKAGQRVPAGYSGLVEFQDGMVASYQNGRGCLV